MSEADSPFPQGPHPGAGITLTVVIPAYNEAQRLPTSFRRLVEVVTDGTIDDATTEFIVVDDGSSDGTADLAEALLAPLRHRRVLRSHANLGKGSAIRLGIAAASGSQIVFTDADMAMDPAQIPLLAKALGEAEVAIASRAIHGHGVDYGRPLRNAMGRLFNRLVRLTTGLALEDTQCGLKGFRAPSARLLFDAAGIERFAFDVEVLVLASRLGLAIAEVPVSWTDVAGSRVRPIADPLSMVADLVRLRFAALPASPLAVLDPAVDPPGGDDACRRLAAGRFPLVRRHADGGSAILVPLTTGEERAALAAELGAALGGARVVTTSLTYERLLQGAPFALSD